MIPRIMTHLVAYFPDRASSLNVAQAFVDGGCSIIEVQFPFSDPTADGVYIQRACKEALNQGFQTQLGFDFVSQLREITSLPIFIMSYANLVYSFGIDNFFHRCNEVAAQGVIVPDLPPDYDEGLYERGRKMEIEVIPVVAPTITTKRLELYGRTASAYIYTALRKGITGEFTQLGEENMLFLEKVKSTGKGILAGFGIQSYEQVKVLAPHVSACVVGSAFIKTILQRGQKPVYEVVLETMKKLSSDSL